MSATLATSTAACCAPQRSRRMQAAALLAATRPRQWPKNLLVLAAALAAGELTVPAAIGPALAATLAMTAVAGGTYLINDARDVVADRAHPTKRFRPVASGRLSIRRAYSAGVVLIAAGLGVAALVGGATLAGVVGGYTVLTLAYSLGLKAIPYLELVIVATGFVLRAIAGGVSAHVPLSAPFLAVTAATAALLVLGKRYAEGRALPPGARGRRQALDAYPTSALVALLVIAGVVALTSYALWALTHGHDHDVVTNVASVAAAGAGLGRYAMLLRAGATEAPEELLLKDRIVQLAAGAALVLFALGTFGG